MGANNPREDDYVVVWTAATMVDAQIAMAALDQAGIPAILEDYDVNPYDGVWVPQQGWAKIRTSAKNADHAREIIKQSLDSSPLDDNTDPEGTPPEDTT